MRVTVESRRYIPFFDLVQLSIIVNYIHIISDYILKDKNSRFYKNILYIMFLGGRFVKKRNIFSCNCQYCLTRNDQYVYMYLQSWSLMQHLSKETLNNRLLQ